MGLPQTTTTTTTTTSLAAHYLYPQTLQLKLYQAFIFSIPILFSIILFLLFYLFYLKKRISNNAPLPIQSINHTSLPPLSEGGLKGMIQKVKLPVILFGDDDSTFKESQCCCICLGEFEMKEELHQIPPCKHIFHPLCITNWLRSNSTCPMCRTSVFIISTSSSSTANHRPPPPSPPISDVTVVSIPSLNNHQHQNNPQHPRTNDHQNEQTSNCNNRREDQVMMITILEGSSSSSSNT